MIKTYFIDEKSKTIENIQKDKENTIKEIELLRSIKRIHKKDGSNFQNFLKNFESKIARISFYYDSWIKISKYPTEILINKYSIDENFIKEIEKINPDRIIKESRLKDKVYYNPDEIMIEIQKIIEIKEKQLKEYENTIKNFENTCQELENRINGICEYLQELKSKDKSYYDFKDLVIKTIQSYHP